MNAHLILNSIFTATIKILRNNCNTHNLKMWRFNSEKYILWRFSRWYVNSWTKLFTLLFGSCRSFSQHDKPRHFWKERISNGEFASIRISYGSVYGIFL